MVLTQASGQGDCRPNGLVQLLDDDSGFQTICGFSH